MKDRHKIRRDGGMQLDKPMGSSKPLSHSSSSTGQLSTKPGQRENKASEEYNTNQSGDSESFLSAKQDLLVPSSSQYCLALWLNLCQCNHRTCHTDRFEELHPKCLR